MDRREREWILGEWGVRDPSPPEQALVRNLERDLEGSPVTGKPLPRRLRNFRPALDSYAAASLAGPPAHVRRLREIEEETAAHERRLAEAWVELARRHPRDPAVFARRWRRVAERWSFDAVNELIERHNRWYPAEARLAMDPRTGGFVLVAGEPYRRHPLGAAWVLERFPPVLPAVAA